MLAKYLDHSFQKKRRLELIEPLIADMVKENPQERPTMDEVVERFEFIRQLLSEHQLIARLPDQEEGHLYALFMDTRHALRHFLYQWIGRWMADERSPISLP
jgi:hypothetical protein